MANPRLFDHEEALRLYLAGFSKRAIGSHFGVTVGAIDHAIKRQIDPVWLERETTRHREWQRRRYKTGACIDCGATIWIDRYKKRQRTGRCMLCVAKAQAFTVREDALLCTRCGEWKPDDDFPRARNRKLRRNRHSQCRLCNTAIKKAWRERNKVPCVDCGELCSKPGKEGRRTSPDGPPRCQLCANRHAHGLPPVAVP